MEVAHERDYGCTKRPVLQPPPLPICHPDKVCPSHSTSRPEWHPLTHAPSFNPIAATYMRSALKTLLDRHFASSPSGARPTQAVLDVIVESSNGDIRSAVMALQFACTADSSTRKPAKGVKKAGKGQGPSARVMLEAVTRREQSLALFHLLGKIMYNKRELNLTQAIHIAQLTSIFRSQEKGIRPLHPHLRRTFGKTKRSIHI